MRPAQTAEILAKLYEGTVDDRAWDDGLMRIAALVGGEGPLLMSSRQDTGELTRYCLYSYDRAVFAEYDRHWLAHDVRVPIAGRRPELSMWTEASLVGRREWLRTPIFNEFLKPNDAPWVLAGSLHSDQHRFTLLCIQGTRARGAFGPEDLDAVLPLLPHLRRALEI
jgi:hypothetical protein